LGKVYGNVFQGGDFWVVTTHLVVTFFWVKVSQAFLFMMFLLRRVMKIRHHFIKL